MKFQSLSIVVPAKEKYCMNNCPYCVSRQHHEDYGEISETAYLDKRYNEALQFVYDSGCHSLILTGDNEPQQNKEFCIAVLKMAKKIGFKTSMQTTGMGMSEQDFKEYANAGLDTIAFSISSLDLSENDNIIYNINKFNTEHIGIAYKYFKVRMCYNLTAKMNKYTPNDFFAHAKMFGASQVTFRKIYRGENDCAQNRWIDKNNYKENGLIEIEQWIKNNGEEIKKLSYGATVYNCDNISTIIDFDCMSKEGSGENEKYAILRPNCKIYTQWDDNTSEIIF